MNQTATLPETRIYGVTIQSKAPCPFKKTGPHVEKLMRMQVGGSEWFSGTVMNAGGLARTMRNRGFAWKFTARTENRDGKPGYRMWRTA